MSEEWFHLIGAGLLAFGAFFCLGGALGLVRFQCVQQQARGRQIRQLATHS